MADDANKPNRFDQLVSNIIEKTTGPMHLGSEPAAFLRQGFQELGQAFDPSRDGSVSQNTELGNVWTSTYKEITDERSVDPNQGNQLVTGAKDVLDWMKDAVKEKGQDDRQQSNEQNHQQEQQREQEDRGR